MNRGRIRIPLASFSAVSDFSQVAGGPTPDFTTRSAHAYWSASTGVIMPGAPARRIATVLPGPPY